MDSNELNLCLGCMNELGEDGNCTNCSYGKDIPTIQPYLAAGTILDNRYLVGRLLTYNGEGASYIGYDKVAHEKVVIREYFPDTFCTRRRGSDVVSVNPDCLAKYKTYMSEFAEVNKTLSRLRSLPNIVPAVDMFAQNNTTYAIYPYVEGVSLKKFLQSNSGRLSWELVKKLFPPVFTSLSLAHNAGIIHRGISLENIIVTTKGELKIIGFCISSIRTSTSELTPELYSGYAAPEQYSSLEWQGAWTDVYAISAVLYRMLTGCVPTEAYRRIGNDDLIAPIKVNPEIPASISHIIMKGMSVKSEDRIQSITELVTRLFEQQTAYVEHEKGATQTIPVQKPHTAAPVSKARTEEDQQAERVKSIVIIALAAFFVLLAIVLIIIVFSGGDSGKPASSNPPRTSYTTPATTPPQDSSLPEESSSQTSATTSGLGEGSLVPKLVGMNYKAVKDSIASSFTIVVTEQYDNPQFQKGYIISQSIEAGTSYNPDNRPELKLVVSAGPSKLTVPTFTGLSKDVYLEILKSEEISYETKTMYSSVVAEGLVCNTSVVPGETVDITKNEVLIVYISLGRDPALPPDQPEQPDPPEQLDPPEESEPNDAPLSDAPDSSEPQVTEPAVQDTPATE